MNICVSESEAETEVASMSACSTKYRLVLCYGQGQGRRHKEEISRFMTVIRVRKSVNGTLATQMWAMMR